MARATVFNTTLLGVEVTPGTRISAVRRLLATGGNIKPVVPVKGFTPQGSKFPTTVVREKEMVEGEYEGTLAFNDIVYLASGFLTTPVITTPAGATLARRWTFTPNSFGPDTPKSYTMEMGSASGAEVATYVLFNSVSLRVTKNEASIKGGITGQILTDGITISTGRNEIQQITRGTNTGGTFTLTYSAQTTASIAFDASASAVQSALEALSNIDPGDITVTGPAGGPWVVTFIGPKGSLNQSQITLTSSLTGGAGHGTSTIMEGQPLSDVPEIPTDPTLICLYVGDSLANEVQTITRQATGGTFTLTLEDNNGSLQTTGAIAFNATGGTVQTALEALSNVNVGDVTVTGAAGGPWTVTFGGRYARQNMPMLIGNDSLLTGVTLPALSIVETTPGGLTKLLKTSVFEWSIADRYPQQFTLDCATSSFLTHVEAAIDQKLKLNLEHDSTSIGFMADLRAKNTKYIMVEFIGPVIETISGDVFNHRIKLTWPFKFQNPDRGDQDDVWSGMYDLLPVYNSTLGSAIEMVVENKLTGLET